MEHMQIDPADPPTLSQIYADLLDSQVERLLSEQQADGAFQPEGAAYSIYDQNAMYPLALSFRRPGGPYYGDERLLEAICRSGDRHTKEMNQEGQWEVITPGGRWGWYFDEWRLYFWLETVLLLGERLGAERLSQWDEAILRGAAGIVDNIRESHERGVIDFREGVGFSSPNHMAWHFLVCRRAGTHYGRRDWVDLADQMFEEMHSGQTEDGFWVESAAPAVNYNYISLLAAGLCLEHRWPAVSPEWIACIEHGMDAQLRWTYPGGGPAAEIDGRQRYHGPTGHTLPAFCARWPRGAAALRESARHLTSQKRVSNHSLAFISETARYLGRHEQPEQASAISDAVFKAQGFEAGWRRKGPWQATLCGIVTKRYDSRWRLDIANLVGIYHQKLGLLAGGGHSKDDPEWATFTLWADKGSDPLWLPTHAEAVFGDTEDRLDLRYEEILAQVYVSLEDAEASVRFAFEPTGKSSAVARLLRPLEPGSHITGPDGKTLALDPGRPIAWRSDAGSEVRVGPVRYILPPGGSFIWPRFPFNPYDRQGIAGAGEAFATFTVPLNASRPQGIIHIAAVNEDHSPFSESSI